MLRIRCARGEVEEARRLFDEMKALGELPRLRTFLPRDCVAGIKARNFVGFYHGMSQAQ